MPVLLTDTLSPTSPLPPAVSHQVYCGLDNCVTLEVHEPLDRLRRESNVPWPSQIYDFERQLQGPYLDMMLHGFAVDPKVRSEAVSSLRRSLGDLQVDLDELARAVWDTGLNPGSYRQLQDFFYYRMKLPEVWLSQKGQRKLSTNREALEKLESYLHARPFVSLILAARDVKKQLDVFETEIDGDGRFRASYNIAGTETGRPSSSTNAFGTGGNAQNIAPSLRHAFVADRGRKLGQIDLEQVEARDVGFFCGCLFDDWSFLNACESGDLHTANARRIWPELAWSGHGPSDRKIAERPFYRDFSYRDMAKRGSHLSNYSGTAWTMARALKIPLPMAEEFQARYCRGRVEDVPRGLPGIEPAYPAIPRYWQWVSQEIQTRSELVTPLGRRRHFFGRTGDNTTLREAIAFLPQSTTADRMNLGLWRIWKKMPEVQVLAQGFDSVTFQFSDRGPKYEAGIISRALELVRVELRSPGGRLYVVPGEAKVGWNWGAATAKNPDGLAKWQAQKPDSRQRTRLAAAV